MTKEDLIIQILIRGLKQIVKNLERLKEKNKK